MYVILGLLVCSTAYPRQRTWSVLKPRRVLSLDSEPVYGWTLGNTEGGAAVKEPPML
jgi:hypothetical protein